MRIGIAKNRHKNRKPRVLPLLLFSLVIIAACAYAFIKATIRPPEITPVPTPQKPHTDIRDPEPSAGEKDNKGNQAIGVDEEPVEAGPIRKDDFYTFLFVGIDKVGANTDVLMVASFDAKNDRIDVVSIPRDTLVNVSRKVKKINAAYAVGGMDNLKKEISTLVGFEPDFHVMVDLKGFVALVDAIGGVDFDVPVNMDYDDPSQDLSIHFEKGMQHLDGEHDLKVVRIRHKNSGRKYGKGYAREDIDRIRTTQNSLPPLQENAHHTTSSSSMSLSG